MSKLPKIGNEISLSEQAYLVIKDAIINNKLKPREILSEEALAAELGISRTPVRSALKRLDFERLITLNPNRNVVVSDISDEDINKIFPVREVVEPLAAKIAAEIITNEQLDELEEIIDGHEEAARIGDYELYLQKDFEFHTYVAKYGNNELLYNIIQNINSHVQRFLILSETLQINSIKAANEHKEVLEAMRNRDVQAAEAKMRAHVKNVAIRIVGNGHDEKQNF